MCVCIDVWLHICIVHWHRGLNPFWPHKFGVKPLLDLEPMAPIRQQLLVSHANHSTTKTCKYVYMYVCMYVCIYVCIYLLVLLFIIIIIIINLFTCLFICLFLYVFLYLID